MTVCLKEGPLNANYFDERVPIESIHPSINIDAVESARGQEGLILRACDVQYNLDLPEGQIPRLP